MGAPKISMAEKNGNPSDEVDLLEGLGSRTMPAANNEEALTMGLAGAAPDLIVSDVRMPGALDGLQLTEKPRELNAGLRVGERLTSRRRKFEAFVFMIDADVPSRLSLAAAQVRCRGSERGLSCYVRCSLSTP